MLINEAGDAFADTCSLSRIPKT